MNRYMDTGHRDYFETSPMPELGLAQTYIRVQPYIGIYPIKEGFHKGNMFPNLFQPY